MINTIFYYPQSKAEYDTEYLAGNIAARTICFVPDEKAIYKGGIRYGSTSISDLKTQIEQIFNENPYTLPIATASRLGGIMIGDGFTIDSSTGKLNVDFSGFTNGTNGRNGLDGLVKTIFDSVTNIRASKNDYGIVKVGDGINVDNGVISVSVSDIANAVVPNISAAATVSNTTGTPTVTVVKTGTDAAPTFTFNFAGIKGEKGDTGATGPQGPAGTTTGGGTTTVQYDDTELRGLIDALDRALDGLSDTADRERDRLDGVIAGLDQDIQNKIEALLDDATWILNNWPAGQTGSTSNFGLSNVEAYLQQIGVWTTDSNGNTVTQWSKIAQDVNSLSTTVAALQVQSGDTGAITALQSSLEQYVDTQIGTATNNLSTTYARKSAEDVLEWMYSALKQQSSADKTFNELVSAGKNDLSSAISEVRTYVEKLKNGDYIATSSIESKVDDAIAGLKNSVSSNNAKTEIFNKISKNSNDISGIVTSITGDSGSAAIGTKIGNWKAGLITTANASTKAAEAGLAVANDVTAAGIVAKINGDSSNIKISANKIDVDGLLSGGDATFIGDFYAKHIAFGYTGDNGTSGAVYDNGWGGLKFGTLDGNTTNGYDVSNTCLYLGAVANGYGFLTLKGSGGINSFLSGGRLQFSSTIDENSSIGMTSISTGSPGCNIDDHSFYAIRSDGNAVELTAKESGSYLYVTDSEGTSWVRGSGTTSSSDIRLKTIIENVNLTAEDLKDAPLFKYTYKTGTTVNTGTSAQYWQTIVPDAVIEDENGYLALNYSKVATVTAITAVKEIAALKVENTTLKERVEALEARLQVIESKFNS